LVTPELLSNRTRIHTGSIARELSGRSLKEISEAIYKEIINYESVFIDSHYAAINEKTGHDIFYQGLEDKELIRLREIPKKIFVLLDGDPKEILERRVRDSRIRSFDYQQILRDIHENRENYFHYLELTGAEGYTIKNGDLKVARNELLEIFR
tara:strand:- start:2275 stop:2733 length:459 start_codon:yes stop_codon:yes gene_type:complete